MLSPYSLSRPGGVQGQVLGLARALRDPGPPGDRGRSRRARGERVAPAWADRARRRRAIGPTGRVRDGAARPGCGRTARWPRSRCRPSRPCGPSASCATVRSTCCTCTSRWPPSPPTGSCSMPRCRWWGRITGPASAGGSRCSSRWCTSSARGCRYASPSPRRRGTRPCARARVSTRCSTTGSTWSGSPGRSRRRRIGRPCCSSGATRRARA